MGGVCDGLQEGFGVVLGVGLVPARLRPRTGHGPVRLEVLIRRHVSVELGPQPGELDQDLGPVCETVLGNRPVVIVVLVRQPGDARL